LGFIRTEESDMLATVAWDADHALSQVRRDRRAIAGRCIWRGKVKLALESSDADWESAPPVTY